ncbi:DoxX family protein [Burkholderia stagnalis]
MLSNTIEPRKDALILVARVLLMLLYLLSGIPKAMHFQGTVAYMASTGAPLPALAAGVAIVVEVAGSVALILGVFTRPLALLLVIYTLGTSLIGHHFWTLDGAARVQNGLHFYKNVSIVGGFLLLAVTGAGKYSVDGR